MRGWFDGFRTDGGPTLYSYSNRTSVTWDSRTLTAYLAFGTLAVAFLVVFPGVRKQKLSTFITVLMTIITGTIVTVFNGSDSWEVGSGEVVTSYRAFSRDKIHATMSVNIGLEHVNVTLQVIPEHNRSLDINFNERFTWVGSSDMIRQYDAALHKGLPYPILTVAEYLTLDCEAFSWGRQYRMAGYYTCILLWVALAMWLLSCIMLVTVPRYGAYLLSVTGFIMNAACLTYYCLRPANPLVINFEDTTLTFGLGGAFWTVLFWGSMMSIFGSVCAILDWIFPHKFSTILDLDFDTPYDRHTIIEDSTDTRQRRFKIPRLEEPFTVGLNAGSRLLRRLSKRSTRSNTVKEKTEANPNPSGVDNPNFQMEERTKPSWKNNTFLLRTDSKKSSKSVKSHKSTKSLKHQSSPLAAGFLDIPLGSPDHEDSKPNPFIRSDSEQSHLSINSGQSDIKSVSFAEDDVTDAPNAGSSSILRQTSNESHVSIASLPASLMSRDGVVSMPNGPSKLESLKHSGVVRTASANIIVFHRTDSRGQLQRLAGEVVEIQTDDSGPE